MKAIITCRVYRIRGVETDSVNRHTAPTPTQNAVTMLLTTGRTLIDVQAMATCSYAIAENGRSFHTIISKMVGPATP